MLLVEGDDDRRVIPWLIEAHGIAWASGGEQIVFFKPFDGIEAMLKPGAIEMELKTPGLEALGVMVDADDDAGQRWQRIRTRCQVAFPGLRETLPATGLIETTPDGLKLGVWLMPDNRSRRHARNVSRLPAARRDAAALGLCEQGGCQRQDAQRAFFLLHMTTKRGSTLGWPGRIRRGGNCMMRSSFRC